jgi:hypothetical protein
VEDFAAIYLTSLDEGAPGLEELGKKNDKLQNFDPASIIDDSFVQDAKKRNVAKEA